MKKVFFLLGFSIPILLSLTFNEAKSRSFGAPKQLVFSVPIKPKATIIIDEYDLKKYLKKGYQAQEMTHTYNGNVKLLMVKY